MKFHRILGVITLAILGAPFAHAQDFQGTVKTIVFDYFTDHKSEVQNFLETSKGERFQLENKSEDLRTGDVVKISGTKKVGTKSLSVGTVTMVKKSALVLKQPVDTGLRRPIIRKVALVLVNFQDNPVEIGTSDGFRDQTFTSTAKYGTNDFYDETTYGRLKLRGVLDPVNGDVFGWYTIPSAPAPCNVDRSAYGNFIRTQVMPLAAAQGLVEANYDSIIFGFPGTDCSGAGGWAEIGGKFSWINSMWHGTVIHELGHNFGLLHANSMTCTDSNGNPVPLSSTCSSGEYGDPFTLMGGAYFQYNDIHKEYLGAFDSSRVKTIQATGAYDGILNLSPTEVRQPSSYQTIKIYRKNYQYFYLEFRNAIGQYDTFSSNDPVVRGVTVRVNQMPNQNWSSSASSSYILDMHPLPPGGKKPTTEKNPPSPFKDAPLLPGEVFFDVESGVRISVPLSENALTSRSVRVEVLPVCPNPAPLSIEMVEPGENIIGPATHQISGSGFIDLKVRVKNSNMAGCFNHSSFLVTTQPPTGFTAQVLSPILTVHPGESVETTVRLSANPGFVDYGVFSASALVKVTDSTQTNLYSAVGIKIDYTPAGCVRSEPQVTVSRANASCTPQNKSIPLTYTVSNSDSSLCPNRVFSLASSHSAPFTTSPPENIITLAPGASASQSVVWNWYFWGGPYVVGDYTVAKQVSDALAYGPMAMTTVHANPAPPIPLPSKPSSR